MDFTDLAEKTRSERFKALFQWDGFDYQRDLIDKAHGVDVFKAAVKPGRQVGKTETGGAIAAYKALIGSDVMILGPFEDTVSEMMEAARNHLETCEQHYMEAGSELGTEYRNKTDWKFHSGRLRARTVGTDGTQIRGKNPDVVLIDEDAYIKDSIHTEVIEPFFSTHDSYEYYLFSTPAGKSGYFYEKVEQDESFYSPHWPSEISPLIDQDFLDEKKAQLDSRTYAQEYLGEFLSAGDTFLSHEDVMPCVADETTLEGRVWLGVDVARKGKDRTVYTAVDEHKTARVLASEDKSTIPGIVGRIKQLHQEHGFESVLVDENAVGGGVVDDEDLVAMDLVQGVKFTTKSKHEMYNRLKTDFEAEDITVPQHRRLIDELTALEFSVTRNGYYQISHPDGGHDDFPDSLAFANWARKGNHPTVTRRNGNTPRSGSTI